MNRPYDVKPDPKNNKVILELKNINKITLFSIRKSLFAIGKDLISEANKEILKKPKGGRLYIRRTKGGSKKRHRASAPLETHANMTGQLRKSMQWKVSGQELDFGYGVAKSTAPEYAAAIEFGKAPGSKPPLIKRPSLRNSITANQRNIEKHLLNLDF